MLFGDSHEDCVVTAMMVNIGSKPYRKLIWIDIVVCSFHITYDTLSAVRNINYVIDNRHTQLQFGMVQSHSYKLRFFFFFFFFAVNDNPWMLCGVIFIGIFWWMSFNIRFIVSERSEIYRFISRPPATRRMSGAGLVDCFIISHIDTDCAPSRFIVF